MARIPDDVIERLKHEVSLERLVQLRGVDLKRHGADLIGLCPMHDDKSPSLVVSPQKNLWHCLGKCQRGGSVIDWVMASEAVSFRHAVEILLRGEPGMATAAPKAVAPLPIEASAEDRELLAQVASYYHDTLKQSAEAQDYLKERGLTHPDVVDHFKLGFANRTLGYRLPSRAGRERLQRLGILRESGHEHFNGSLVIPILGGSDVVLGMYGRKITPTLRTGTPVHLYLPGPHRGVFNVSALEDSKTIILCEALIDALTFWCAGFKNVTASYGVEGFTTDHLDAFRRHGTERVLIAYDRDEAGDAAADRLAPKLMAEGIECWRIQFPHRMDANEYARKVTPAEKGLGLLLRNAVWLGKGARPIVDLGATSKESGEALATGEKVLDRDFVAELAVPEPAPVPALPLAAKEEIETPPAMVEPPQPTTPETSPDEVTLDFGERRYRVRGLAKNLSHEALRVNVLVSRGDLVHVDTLDLYSSRQRAAFIKQAASELKAQEQTIKEDASHLLRRLEEIQEERIKRALEPKVKEVKLSDEETREALALLRDPQLLDRVLTDFAACGTVGEETNKLIGYIAAVSRKLDEPLAVIIQSSSAAGKTSLMEAILSMMPVEERVKYSAMTGQSLFYMGETDLKHKILAIVEEQGAERASYALKLLQSEGELMIASTGKDPATGRLVTHEYRVEGPVMIFLTTTAIEIDEELLNRCLVLTVDEDRDQTRAIHKLQRERQTLEGLLARRSRPGILKVHQDAQRLLKPLLVANPYAPSLTFLDDRTRTRRDHVKYLTLIRTITLLHQYQRPIRSVEHRGAVVPYIEVTLEDIAIANRLAHQVLGRSLDELAPQTRRLLMSLELMVSEACAARKIERAEYRFTRKDVRAATGWNQTQLRMHLDRLVDLEYVTAHHGKQGQGYVYELLYDGQGKDGVPFLPGLIDVQALCTTETSRGQTLYFAGSSRAESGPLAGPSRGDGGFTLSVPVATESALAAKEDESAHRGPRAEAPSRRTFGRRTAAVR